MNRSRSVLIAAFVALPHVRADAAELPAHDPMRILVVSDEVNPHGLANADLTQPGEVSEALGSSASGLNLAEPVAEVNSACIDEALARLDTRTVDVLVYFAHVAAKSCDGTPRQSELTIAVERLLVEGGGVVAFHHGIYESAEKEAMLMLLGATASSYTWDAQNGQDVIAVAPEHFVASHGLHYESERPFVGVGVPAGEFPAFANIPDERYDALSLLVDAGESREILFASASAAGADARILGYDLHRPGWIGHVVFYQPGEYQPHALDFDGANFQILVNAVFHAASAKEMGEPERDPASTDGTGGPVDDETGGTTTEDSATDDRDPSTESGGTLDIEPPGQDTERLPRQDCSSHAGSPRSNSGALALVVPMLVLGRRRRTASRRARPDLKGPMR